MERDGSLAGRPTPLLCLGSGSTISFLVDFMAALAQSLELLPGISVMWTPSELSCTQFETDFKDVLLLVFKRKFYCPQRGSIPWLPSSPAFPFLHRTAGFWLHWSAAALAASKPLTSPYQHAKGVMFPPPHSLPQRKAWQSSRVLWKVSSSRIPAGHPGLLLASAPLLHWGQNMVFGGARMAALLPKQHKCLSWNRSEELTCFLNKANSHPFYHKSLKSWISLCPGNSSSGR